jgi:hypothetical protein
MSRRANSRHCGRQEKTRFLVALAADRELEVRALFNQLADGFIVELTVLLTKLGIEPATANADLVHALFVGLSVIQLAPGRTNGQAQSRAALTVAFGLLASQNLKSETAAAETATKLGSAWG